MNTVVEYDCMNARCKNRVPDCGCIVEMFGDLHDEAHLTCSPECEKQALKQSKRRKIERMIMDDCNILYDTRAEYDEWRPDDKVDHTTKGFWGDCKNGCWIVVCNRCGWLRHELYDNRGPCDNCGSPMNYPPGAEW